MVPVVVDERYHSEEDVDDDGNKFQNVNMRGYRIRWTVLMQKVRVDTSPEEFEFRTKSPHSGR